jgi:hypothetical protein
VDLIANGAEEMGEAEAFDAMADALGEAAE